MKKLSINYNRKFPDHRTTYDVLANQRLSNNPRQMFKMWKAGFNANNVKFLPLYLSIYAMFGAFFYGTYKFWNYQFDHLCIARTNNPNLKYAVLSQKPGYGKYDNILHKFQGQDIMDQEH